MSRATATREAMQYRRNQAHLCVSAQQGRVSSSRSQARATSTCSHRRLTAQGCLERQLTHTSIALGAGDAQPATGYHPKDSIQDHLPSSSHDRGYSYQFLETHLLHRISTLTTARIRQLTRPLDFLQSMLELRNGSLAHIMIS